MVDRTASAVWIDRSTGNYVHRRWPGFIRLSIRANTGIPSIAAKDVHRPLLQLCSGFFGHSHGVNGGPRLRMKQGVKVHQHDLSGGWVPDVGNMDTTWHPHFGVAVENLGWISGALATCWTRKSSELGLSSYPSSEDSSDKSSELRAHQISVGGSFGGFLHAELSANCSSELSAEVISQSWRQHENPRRAPVDFLFWEEFFIQWFSVETSTFLWS